MKKTLNKLGLKNKGDFSVLIIMFLAIGPGTLVLLSWVLGIFDIHIISDLLDAIFVNFILFVYLLISTLAAIIWWGFIIFEKLSNNNQ